jgi:hypothetical protein
MIKMSQHEFEAWGGEESWLRTVLGEIPQPELQSDNEMLSKNPGLKLTIEEYEAAPEKKFGTIQGAELVVGMEEVAVLWRGYGTYRNSLIVRQQGSDFADEGFVLIGGSIYVPPTRSEMLTDDEKYSLPRYAWQQDKAMYATTSLETPFVVAPGVICQEAHVYFRPAFALHELRKDDMVDHTIQQPVSGSLISVEKSPGKTTTLFVSDMAYITPPVQNLHRVSGDNLFQRL